LTAFSINLATVKVFRPQEIRSSPSLIRDGNCDSRWQFYIKRRTAFEFVVLHLFECSFNFWNRLSL